ncbi:TonB-dependent receptor [Bergeyella sp. RCAD1439]|uniref:TonB-dependent receptor n=1 Tax=Bergeyella anatis TaxID=3113737 RepID=UPI002E17C5B2|nr:TonB-dependent receptor [Bergeyella sp. RCAD1439]
MNYLIRIGVVFLLTLVAFTTIKAQNQTIITETAEVSGNCSMCKTTIEKAAKYKDGISATWDQSTKILTLIYPSGTTSKQEVLRRIAEAGYENELFHADPSAYTSLPECCKYTRTKSVEKSFFVRGNCNMCKARIEKAATAAGAQNATWNASNQTLSLIYNAENTSTDVILRKIADAGHDNERFRASDEAYRSLADCCLYERDKQTPTASDTHHHDHASPHDHSIEEVKLTKAQAATSIDGKSAGLTFQIGRKELLKAACCNLSESFETNATVDVNFSNAVTGTKQLKILGLDQKYTALTKELLPDTRGLASAYGLGFIPGRWIGGIQLTKGGSSVTNGYESITGQINTEFLKYKDHPETTLNLFLDNNARTEANITHTSQIAERWTQSILLHGNATLAKMDYNHDGFLDQPTGTQTNLAYLVNYNDLEHSGLGFHFGINFLQDRRNAGQTDFNKQLSPDRQNAYGVNIDISRIQTWTKIGYIFPDKPYQSIGWMNQYTFHQQDSFFGHRTYFGSQNTFYSNLVFESIIGNTNHKYKTGTSFLFDGYRELYLASPYHRKEYVPGLFFEYTLTGRKYTLVSGLRTDFHNLAGTQLSPRVNFKYDFSPQTILRLSAGRGFRTANIFAESQAFFASSRTLEWLDSGGRIYGLKAESAWNYGISLQKDFKFLGRKSSIVTDFFKTDFKDQVVMDLDQSSRKILFYNLNGRSFAHSFQTQWDFSPLKNLEFRMAYKYYDVQTDYTGGRRNVPFIAKHRGFVNIAYSTPKNEKGAHWSFDTTLNLVGSQRLPLTKDNPSEFQLSSYSKPFSTLNAQISKHLNAKSRLYLGGENLTSYRQNHPIIDAANPFGSYFDGGLIYAPIMPAMIYIGADVNL